MSAQKTTHILILGGGFGGVFTAQGLIKHFKRDSSVKITLVNRDNYFVFVPMLASAAVGSIETLHVVMPIRSMIPGAQFRAEEVTDIDLKKRVVSTFSNTTKVERHLDYDHLVIALGNVIDRFRISGAAQHAMTIKSLDDAFTIRNHILRMLEAADIETDPVIRGELLTFVVAGGGFSGVEMVGELNDFVRDVIKHYPSISADQVKVILLHSRDRILPEVSDGLADYALIELRKRHVEVRLNTRLKRASAHGATLDGGSKIPTRSLIVAVGNAAPKVLDQLDIKKERGKIVVNDFMQVPDHPGVWALGDNAIVPNRAASDGLPSPPTAQYALRQGKTLAHNIAANTQGKELKPFAFGGLGLLCLLGHGVGVGELPLGIKVKGFLGWFLWRFVYWSKLPSIGRKFQIGIGWLFDLFLHREMSQINTANHQTVQLTHYDAGEVIFRKGEPGQYFYVISAGQVDLIGTNAAGEEIALTQLVKGNHFGESALSNGGSHQFMARCASEVDVLTLERQDFKILTDHWPEFVPDLGETAKQLLENFPEAFMSAEATQAPGGAAHLLRRDSGGEIVLERDLISIGRSSDNHIVVPDPKASRRHALLQQDGPNYVIEEVEDVTNGTWINERRISEATVLNDGDVIRIGSTEFEFGQTQPLVVPQVATQSQAMQLIHAESGQEFEFDRDLVRLGRSSNSDVIARDPKVSRNHALIQRKGDVYQIEHVGGQNGTWLNGARVEEPTPLNDGDEIRIGDTRYTFRSLASDSKHLAHSQKTSDDLASITQMIHGLDAEGGSVSEQGQISPLTAAIHDLDAKSEVEADPDPASITGLIENLDESESEPRQASPLTVEIRELDARPKTPQPKSSSKQEPDPASITGLIQDLDEPSDEPKKAGPITEAIHDLDAQPEEKTLVESPSDVEVFEQTIVDSASSQVTLMATSGPNKGQTFEIGQTAVVSLGRTRDNTICIRDKKLSRNHARIEFRSGSYWLEDLKSTNKTFVNEVIVEEPYRLQSGDVIRLGSTHLLVTILTTP